MIVPETVVCDHGMVYLSQAFRAACRAMGVNFQPGPASRPGEGEVEQAFASVASLFAQYVAGYTGRSVDRRGKRARAGRGLVTGRTRTCSIEWIVAHWRNRRTTGCGTR